MLPHFRTMSTLLEERILEVCPFKHTHRHSASLQQIAALVLRPFLEDVKHVEPISLLMKRVSLSLISHTHTLGMKDEIIPVHSKTPHEHALACIHNKTDAFRHFMHFSAGIKSRIKLVGAKLLDSGCYSEQNVILLLIIIMQIKTICFKLVCWCQAAS